MISISSFKILENSTILFCFSDGTDKTIDFNAFIGNDELSKPLLDSVYFKKIELYENGRGIYWPNGYDFCPDFLHQYRANKVKLDAEKS